MLEANNAVNVLFHSPRSLVFPVQHILTIVLDKELTPQSQKCFIKVLLLYSYTSFTPGL